ncbi:hypothetical protein TgHK011_003251 [Trichoderma gracile]|nr:hypothetical protein TgHK011_003251 [Trichoderma gracile]
MQVLRDLLRNLNHSLLLSSGVSLGGETASLASLRVGCHGVGLWRDRRWQAAVDSAPHRFIVRWVCHEQTVGRFLRVRQLTVASSAQHAHA